MTNFAHVHLKLLQPVGQVLCGAAVLQRGSESSPDLFFALFKVSVDPVQLTGQVCSSGTPWRTVYRDWGRAKTMILYYVKVYFVVLYPVKQCKCSVQVFLFSPALCGWSTSTTVLTSTVRVSSKPSVWLYRSRKMAQSFTKRSCSIFILKKGGAEELQSLECRRVESIKRECVNDALAG